MMETSISSATAVATTHLPPLPSPPEPDGMSMIEKIKAQKASRKRQQNAPAKPMSMAEKVR